MAATGHGLGFGDIEFGYASAEKEGAEVPDLLLSGFVDDANLTRQLLWGSPFLFLGYKGSGKTALAEHCRLIAETRPDVFVTTTTLERFSYGDFKSVAGGSSDVQARYPTAWGWLLLVALVESLQRDQAGLARAPAAYRAVVSALEKLGLTPRADLALMVTTSSKQSFKAALPRFLEYTTERVSSAQDLQMYQVVSALREAVTAYRTDNRHVIVIDGLDSIVTQKDLQFQSLAALVQEAAELNQLFRRERCPFKFVVLCRTDMFDRLPGANINKLRQDESVILTWYDDSGDPEDTRLLTVVSRRARRSLGRDVNVFAEFFPPKVDDRDTRKLVLDHTRHIPRDLVQLLRKLQQSSAHARTLNPVQVRRGLRSYSTEYFLPELRNELAGYLDSEDIEKALMMLSSLQRARVAYADVERAAADLDLGGAALRALLRALFDASCVGTATEGPGRRPYYRFKYRNPTASIMPGQDIRIHPGALKGLNIDPGVAAPSRPDNKRRRRRSARRG